MATHISEIETLLSDLLSEEERLRQAYAGALPSLRPSTLRTKIEEWVGDGGLHIRMLRTLEAGGSAGGSADGEAADQTGASLPGDPEGTEAHRFLDFFYRAEERLYYHYQNGLETIKEEGLRSLVLSHIKDQEKHLSAINHLYSEFLYF